MLQYYKYKLDVETIYEIVAEGKGAGPLKGQEFITYRNTETGECYIRERSDFHSRMVPMVRDIVY